MFNFKISKIITTLSLAFFVTAFQTPNLIAANKTTIEQESTQYTRVAKRPNVLTTIFFAASAISGSSALHMPRGMYMQAGCGNKDIVNVLSFDGGTSGGICELVALSQLEDRMGKPIHEIFDLAVGASAGCLDIAVLTQPSLSDSSKPIFTPSEYLEIKKKESGKIFSKFRLLPSLFDPKGPEELYNSYFGNSTYDHTTMPRAACVFDIKNLKTRVISSKDNQNTYKTTDVVLSSTAFPFVFPPRLLSPLNSGGAEYLCIDGATLDINPAFNALIKARELYPDAKEFRLLSLGNGIAKGSNFCVSASKEFFTYLDIVTHLLNLDIDPYEADISQALSAAMGNNFIRFAPVIANPKAFLGVDLNALEQSTIEYLKTNKNIIPDMIKMLKK